METSTSLGGQVSSAPAQDADLLEASVLVAGQGIPEPPSASSPAVRKCMQGNKRRNTSPELKVRTMLREMGFPGYRLDWKKAKGHPDIAYPGRKIAIFVNGCFWHRCPECRLQPPKSNVNYWLAKFERNVERDKETYASLEEAGWKVIIIWEHELKKKALEETYEKLELMLRPHFQ